VLEGSITVGIIGTGLMGGSLALALGEHPRVKVVLAYDHSEETRRKARELGVADEVTDSAEEAVLGCDLVFLATPISAMPSSLREVSGSLKNGTVVTDLGSSKMSVVDTCEEIVSPGVHFLGGHPMTGSEQSGVEAARKGLYLDCYYILTPTHNTASEAFSGLHCFLTDMGARVLAMDPLSHDRVMATISHVPHLLSLLLMDLAARQSRGMTKTLKLAAGGFRDMTRIAASSADVWVDICMDNNRFITERLLEFGSGITEIVDMLESRDREGLRELFERARNARVEMSVRAGREIEQLYEVAVPVPDRPGVIGEISAAVGSLGINIEDIEITHPLEGETGIMTLKILGGEHAAEAVEKLSSLDYRPGLSKL
jgi:prephenate dehydrogenase